MDQLKILNDISDAAKKTCHIKSPLQCRINNKSQQSSCCAAYQWDPSLIKVLMAQFRCMIDVYGKYETTAHPSVSGLRRTPTLVRPTTLTCQNRPCSLYFLFCRAIHFHTVDTKLSCPTCQVSQFHIKFVPWQQLLKFRHPKCLGKVPNRTACAFKSTERTVEVSD